MGIKLKRILSAILVMAMTFGIIPSSISMAETIVNSVGYEIYPNPHEVNYTGDQFVIRKEVNVVYDSTIDESTKNRMTEVLESKDKNITESNEIVKGKTNILVGTYSSKEYVDEYIQENYDINTDLFEKTDSYYLIVKDGTIAVLGKDTDAAFYGITSLKHIFSQMDGSTIKNLKIKDYADTAIRGFIEGYYGIPWSNEDRMSLMEFGGEFKMTSYIFAPKDDLYHTKKWRELYPADELEAIAEMVEVGRESKTRFVWTAHPFMGGFNSNDYENEIKKLKAKFEQLYSVGVRQFGILGDDVGSLNKQIVIDMMTELSNWGKEKGDVYDFVFCPAGYNHSWQGDYSELNLYDKDFPEDVQIFWTGNSVCAPVSNDTLTKFRTNALSSGSSSRRSPLFWLNWPVNDINMKRLMMGKGSLLHTDIKVDDLAGVVTNPMQDAEPSKVSIFAVADYTWNIKSFDDDKSWEDSFKYIDDNAPEALHIIAKHTSDPAPNGHGLVLEESEEIKPLLEEFKTKLNSGSSVIEVGNKLVNEMDIIIEACDEFISTSQNERMVEQITPFANSLKDLATAIKEYVNTAVNLEKGNDESVIQSFSEGTIAYENSKNYHRVVIGGTKSAEPGSKRLLPFFESIKNVIATRVNNLVNVEESLIITPSTNMTNIYSGNIANITDGKADTFIWFGQGEQANQYYQLTFNKPTTIYGVNILNGTPNKLDDTFNKAKVQYTTDGTTWKDINSKIYGPYATTVKITGIELENVIGVRYICTENSSLNKWPAMREFSIYTTPQKETTEFTKTLIRTTNGWTIYSGSDANVIDGNESTGIHYNVRQGGNPANTTIAGDFVGVKLSQPIILGKIDIVQGQNSSSGDYFKDATLEYSLDGVNYTAIEKFTNSREIRIDLSNRNIEAQYIRLRNNVNQGTWIGFREFGVAEKINHNGKVYTNVDNYKDHPADYYKDNFTMVALENITLNTGEYIGLKLDRIHELTNVTLKGTSLNGVTIQVSKNSYEWTTINNGDLSETIDARYIRLVNLSNNSITFSVTEFKGSSREFNAPTVIQASMPIIAEGKIENLFDKDRTTALKYQKTQVKGDYIIIDLGQEIDLKELKLVVHDSNPDYIRDGKVYASTNTSEWGEEIIIIGDQIANTEANDSTVNESFPEHEISYNVAKATNIGRRARYIKIEITQPYAHRWTRLNEIEINNGEYIPTVNNPTFKSNKIDTPNGLYEYLIDGNITTMYIPKENIGYLVYSISDKNSYNSIRIMQNAKQISNAEVKARVIKDNKVEWITLGTLNKSTNEFVMPVGTNILDIKFEWNGVVPNLVELSINSVKDVNVNKQRLVELINENLVTEDWTNSTAQAYKQAIEVAKEIQSNSYVSQTTVYSTVKEIENAKQNKLLKGNSSLLQDKINNAIADADSSKYTNKTWAIYKNALNIAIKAMEDTNNLSESDITKLINALDSSRNALVYNPTNREEAEINLEDINEFIESITTPESKYTVNSWSLLKAKKEALEQLIELNKTEAQDPTLFENGKNDLLNAKDSLISIGLLPTLINEFNEIPDASIYTEASYAYYENEVNKAKEVMINGTSEEVKIAEENILDAKSKLEIKSVEPEIDKSMLVITIEYAENVKSEGALEDVVPAVVKEFEEALINAKSVLEDKDATEAQVDEATKRLVNAIHMLEFKKGNKTELVSLVEIINALNKSQYKSSTWTVLENELKNANEVIADENAMEEEVKDAYNNLIKAYLDLRLIPDKSKLEELVGKAKAINLSIFTEESVEEFKIVLEEAEVILADENVEEDQVEEATNKLEEVMNMLEIKKADKSEIIKLVEVINALESSKYTTSSWNVLKSELEKANEVIANENALDEDVVNAYEKLVEAQLNLKLIADKAKLQEVINKAEAIDTSKYTVESVKEFNLHLDESKIVLNNEEAIQEEVDKAVVALENAIDKLETKTEQPSTNPEKPGDSDKPPTGEENSNLPETGVELPKTDGKLPETDGKSQETGNDLPKTKVDLPETGGENPMIVILFALVLLGGGAFLIFNNKKAYSDK